MISQQAPAVGVMDLLGGLGWLGEGLRYRWLTREMPVFARHHRYVLSPVALQRMAFGEESDDDAGDDTAPFLALSAHDHQGIGGIDWSYAVAMVGALILVAEQLVLLGPAGQRLPVAGTSLELVLLSHGLGERHPGFLQAKGMTLRILRMKGGMVAGISRHKGEAAVIPFRRSIGPRPLDETTI